jgi:hypothetical protein
LWTKITQHGERKTLLVVPNSIITQLLEGIHSGMLYGPQGQLKKESHNRTGGGAVVAERSNLYNSYID